MQTQQNYLRCMLLLLVFIYVKCQYGEDYQVKPNRCHAPAEFLTRQCCVFPPFFARDIAKACGAIFSITFLDKQNNVTGLRRNALTGCDHWRCVLQKYGILATDDYIDDEKYYNHLDKWVDLNPSFAAVMLKAKVQCKQIFRFYMPLKVCEFYQFNLCVRNGINVECPVLINTKECIEQKQFFDECRMYYLRK